MASADWIELTGSVGTGILARGVTQGTTKPAASGSNLYAYAVNSLSTTEGAYGMRIDDTDFDPTDYGASVRGALVRLGGGGNTGFAPMLFAGLQSSNVNAMGYLLGLQDCNPSRIVLRKGSPLTGLPDGDPDPDLASVNILRRSTASIAAGTWVHLRLDVIQNASGDVVLVCKRNTGDIDGPPTWEAIPGMDSFTDDVTGIATGSVPLLTGYVGFAQWTSDVARAAAFDHIEAASQPAP